MLIPRGRSKHPVLLCLWVTFLALPVFAQLRDAAAYSFKTIAGEAGSGSSDGIGGSAQFNHPAGVAADNAGIYVTDFYNHTIRKITTAGVVSTIAGFPGSPGSANGNNGAARFNSPAGIAADGAGNLYVADQNNDTIRKLTLSGTNWVVGTIAGLAGIPGTEDGTNNSARFFAPSGITADTNGNLYVADGGNQTIRMITRMANDWVVTTITGLARTADSLDGTNNSARFRDPQGIAMDYSGNLYVADTDNYTIRKITHIGTNWVVNTIAGTAGSIGTFDGTNGYARFGAANIAQPYGGPNSLTVDSLGNLYVTDSGNHTIREVMPFGSDWVVSTLAGLAGVSGTTDGVGSNARFDFPAGVTLDSSGNIFVADSHNNTVRKVTSAGVVRTAAGLTASAGGADGVGSNARFNFPEGVAVDSAGNIYLADTDNHTIRQISSAGLVTTVAGLAGNSGTSNGVAGNARFSFPSAVAVDGPGNIYVADTQNYTIRKITPAGVVSTISGSAGMPGTLDGTNSDARFSKPQGIALHGASDLYVADGASIRKVTKLDTNWVAITLKQIPGEAQGLALDSAGNIYVTAIDLISGTDLLLLRLTSMDTNWTVNTIGQWSASAASYRSDLALDSAGNIYVADAFNSVIRKITYANSNWVANIIGGAATRPGSADGDGIAAQFNVPQGIALDSAGNIYVADSDNNIVRKGVFTAYTPTNPVPYSPPAMNGQLVVILSPPEANGQWRLPWELGWRNSGEAATNLEADDYTIQLRNVPGWLVVPFCCPVTVTNNGTKFLTNQYYPTIGSVDTNTGGGSLTVNIGPSPPPEAGWHFLGDVTPSFPPGFPPGFTTNLLPGTYLIEFVPITNYSKPPNLSVPVFAGQPTVISVNYTLASARPDQVLFPFPVPVDSISRLTDYPFGFNGQLQTDVGYGSGVAVQTNVVLTAAHLVFDDQTLSYVSQAFWYFQQEAGLYSPQPLIARGWYVLSGYAAQRTNDLGHHYDVDESSAASRNLDVAALYFPRRVPWNGYGGYLPSDDTPNPWLTGTSLKMLVGYPVDGSLFGDTSITNGVMYQTAPQPYELSLSPDQVDNQRVYVAPWFLSYPGNSGGPFYVQLNGYYYPAAVYLGTLYNGSTYQSVVRAIDSDVVNLIGVAERDAGTGTNNTGGGVITIIPGQVSTSNPGYVQFQLAPPTAVQQGAAWRLVCDTCDTNYSTASNYTLRLTSTNAISVDFKPIPGWNLPTNQSVSVQPGQISTPSAFYVVSNPVLVATATLGIGLTGTTGTVYRIETRSSLNRGTWSALTTNTITSNGFNPALPPPAHGQPTAYYRAVWLP